MINATKGISRFSVLFAGTITSIWQKITLGMLQTSLSRIQEKYRETLLGLMNFFFFHFLLNSSFAPRADRRLCAVSVGIKKINNHPPKTKKRRTGKEWTMKARSSPLYTHGAILHPSMLTPTACPPSTLLRKSRTRTTSPSPSTPAELSLSMAARRLGSASSTLSSSTPVHKLTTRRY